MMTAQSNKETLTKDSKVSKRGEILLACGALLGLLMAVSDLIPENSKAEGRGIVAQVNGYAISELEYQAMQAKVAELNPSNTLYEAEQRKKLIDMMVEERLLAQQAIIMGLPMNDERLRKMLAAAVVEWQTMAISSESVDEEQLRLFYRDNISLFQGSDKLAVMHMRFRCKQSPCNDFDNSYQRAKLAYDEIAKGNDFSEIKQQYADSDLLNLPNQPISQKELHHLLGKTLSEEAYLLIPEKTSEPIMSGNSYHLLKLITRQQPQALAFGKVKSQVIKVYQQREKLAVLRDYLAQLKAEADIMINEAYLTEASPLKASQSLL